MNRNNTVGPVYIGFYLLLILIMSCILGIIDIIKQGIKIMEGESDRRTDTHWK